MKFIKKPSIKFMEFKNGKAHYIARYRYGDIFKSEYRDYRLPKKVWELI